MSTTAAPAPVSEREAREVAEAARETDWVAPSFVRGLFDGRFRFPLVFPFPPLDPAEEERARPFLTKLAAFLKEHVNAEEIEKNSKIPPEVIRGLADLGCFGINIPVEYGGLGFHQSIYNRAVCLAASAESSIDIRTRVERARAIAVARSGTPNASLGNDEIERTCALASTERAWLENALARFNLSARAFHRVLKVARTIADLAAEPRISTTHLSEAIQYRRLDRGFPG